MQKYTFVKTEIPQDQEGKIEFAKKLMKFKVSLQDNTKAFHEDEIRYVARNTAGVKSFLLESGVELLLLPCKLHVQIELVFKNGVDHVPVTSIK